MNDVKWYGYKKKEKKQLFIKYLSCVLFNRKSSIMYLSRVFGNTHYFVFRFLDFVNTFLL